MRCSLHVLPAPPPVPGREPRTRPRRHAGSHQQSATALVGQLQRFNGGDGGYVIESKGQFVNDSTYQRKTFATNVDWDNMKPEDSTVITKIAIDTTETLHIP